MLCADADPSRGTCKGDSGGPLIYNGKLVGLTSFGATSRDGLCSGGADDVYTRVSAVRDWVLGQRF
jgi:secreted trypsin-like serine protease